MRKLLGPALLVTIVIAVVWWYATQPRVWPAATRDAFLQACAQASGIRTEAAGTPEAAAARRRCECSLEEMQRRLSLADYEREEQLMVAAGKRPTPLVLEVGLKCAGGDPAAADADDGTRWTRLERLEFLAACVNAAARATGDQHPTRVNAACICIMKTAGQRMTFGDYQTLERTAAAGTDDAKTKLNDLVAPCARQ